MSDILYEAARSFLRLTKYDYIYTLGNSKKQIKISVLSSQKADFTHICGIDHLTDIPSVTGHTRKQKLAIYNHILSGKIVLNDIASSQNFEKPILGTYNSSTNSPYTICERIASLVNLESILDNSYKGHLYRWNSSNSDVIAHNGSKRIVSINADYLLTVPSDDNKDEHYYIFLYQTNRGKLNEPIKLNIFSAFSDCVNLAMGQAKPYKILRMIKRDIDTNKERELYAHPLYNME